MKRLLLVLALLPLAGQAGTIYLCKAYSGGTFWAQAHCGQHNALIESIVSVPDNMPFGSRSRWPSNNDGRHRRRPPRSTRSPNRQRHSSTRRSAAP